MNNKIFERQTLINRPLKEVFEFFSNAENLNILTPVNLSFKILTSLPIQMHKGVQINYQLKFKGIPFKWKTLIVDWEPPFKFVDEQINGPFAKWEHIHLFEARDGKTLMTDKLIYRSKGGFLANVIHFLFVDKDVKQIFEYRKMRLNELFPDT
nr:SRPBCC family protein [Pseudopedobacter sp.]